MIRLLIAGSLLFLKQKKNKTLILLCSTYLFIYLFSFCANGKSDSVSRVVFVPSSPREKKAIKEKNTLFEVSIESSQVHARIDESD